MCTYGIGAPFDHPIWRSLPPCRCGNDTQPPTETGDPLPEYDPPDFTVRKQGHYCPMCGVWHVEGEQVEYTTTNTSGPSVGPVG